MKETSKHPFRRSLPLCLLLALGCCSDDPNGSPGADAGPARDVGADAAADVRTDAVAPITFPADEAPHTEQMEWWYYTGRVTTKVGGVYGFELTFFQPRIGGKFVHIVHLAFTDMVKKSYSNVMQITGEKPPAQPAEGFWLKVGQTEIKGHAGKDQIKAVMNGYALDLDLTATKPVTLQYGTGWMKVGSDAPFYYYSYTNMAATGSLTSGKTKEAVTGTVWMDHQWGTIGAGYGWDWFSLRLDDGGDLMLFNVKREGKIGFSGGTLVRKDGTTVTLKAGDFTVTATGSWTSPHTKTTYSHGWKISAPKLKLDATVTPLLADQEFSHTIMGTPTYWEGLCDVTGTRDGKKLTGHGYVEITGKIPKL